jgi:hypothetical protein
MFDQLSYATVNRMLEVQMRAYASRLHVRQYTERSTVC